MFGGAGGSQHPSWLSFSLDFFRSFCFFCYLRSLFRLLVGLSPALSAAVGVEQRRAATQEQTHTVLSDSPPAVRKIPRQAEAGGDGEAPQGHGGSLEPVSRGPAARVSHRCSSIVRQHRRLRGTRRRFLPTRASTTQRKGGKEGENSKLSVSLVKAET